MWHNHQHHNARERYRRSVRKARLADLWGRITGGKTDLVRFADVAQPLQLRQQIPRGIRLVALPKIVGSVGRAQDFTGAFLPRSKVNAERWAQIEMAFQQMVALPPVDLYQVGTVYFVRDGHHRISVAQVNGLDEIEADVVELASPVQLQIEDFQHNRWTKIVKQEQEKTMFTLDPDMAKRAFEERLQQAEHERLVRRMLANQPKPYTRVLEKLGDLLITLGTNLKAQLPQELAKA